MYRRKGQTVHNTNHKHRITRRKKLCNTKNSEDDSVTKAEIIKSEKEFLIPTDIAEILETDAQSIRQQAEADPAVLGFPVVRIGSRTKIPRIRFVEFMGWDNG